MKNFIIYDSTGRVLRSGTCQDEYFASQVQNSSEFIMEYFTTTNYIYVDNGEVKPLPPQPLGFYKFDYQIKAWVPDTEMAAIEVQGRRRALLADGPDRISPIWWSAMSDSEKQAWTDYRQALLDITNQPNYPLDVIWPIVPTGG